MQGVRALHRGLPARQPCHVKRYQQNRISLRCSRAGQLHGMHKLCTRVPGRSHYGIPNKKELFSDKEGTEGTRCGY